MKLLLALALIAPLSAAPAVKTDIRYQHVRGSLPERQRLDVHYDDAKTTGKQPVLLWIHGGAWRFGNKDHATPQKAAALHKADIILVATDHRYLKAAKVDPGIIKAVIPLDGAGYDIPHHLKTAGPRAAKTYTTVFTADPATQKHASPITHVRKDNTYPPFLIIPCASRADSTDQSHRLAKALRAAGSEATVSPAKNKTHMTLNKEWGTPGDSPTKVCLEFLTGRFAGK